MKTSLLLILFGIGLVLVSARANLSRIDTFPGRSATPDAAILNDQAGDTGVPNRAPGNRSAAGARNANSSYDGPTTFNMASATLAGTFTLLLLQRRYRDEAV